MHENKISLINVTSQPNQFPIWLPASFTEIFHWTIAFNILEENFLDWSTFNHLVKSNFPIQSLLTSIFSDAGNLKSMLMALHCIALQIPPKRNNLTLKQITPVLHFKPRYTNTDTFQLCGSAYQQDYIASQQLLHMTLFSAKLCCKTHKYEFIFLFKFSLEN